MFKRHNDAGTDPVRKLGSVDDARFMLGQLATLTNNADTKAGLIATATTVLLGALLSQRDELVRTIRNFDLLSGVALTVFTAAILAALVAAVCVARALWPRTDSKEFSRYSWPSVADVGISALISADPVQERHEAWYTAQTVARILAKKYRSLRGSLIAWLVSALLTAVWFVLVV